MIGQTLGAYRVVDKLGEGGMGAVYRAHDTKLNRDVALKVLPELVAGDPDRLARFRREAQVLASLNHPNIAHLYGFEDAGGSHALVMELVEGATLAERIHEAPSHLPGAPGLQTRGLPIADAVAIARQIADALETAHEQGIVHRDLKPANIKVRDDGTVKVLDFGLAKALGAPGSEEPGLRSDASPGLRSDAANSPTLTARATQMGMILGTAGYMAPEQARGRPVDRRADIWAFGVVLYEMLAGKRAFEGEDISITLASVLKEDVDWKALPADLPPALGRLLRRCLEKDPRRRLSAIGDARLELDEAMASPQPGEAATGPGADARLTIQQLRTRARLGWLTAGVAFLLFIAAAVVLWRGRAEPLPPERMVFSVLPSVEATQAGQLLPWVSPDGRMIAYTGPSQSAGPTGLWVRSLDGIEPRMLTVVEGTVSVSWSPDSRSIVFVSRGSLYRVSVDGGAPQTLAEVPDFSGAAWLPTGDIVVASSAAAAGRLLRVSTNGGPPVEIAPPSGRERALNCRFPAPLPGGDNVLCLDWSLEPERRTLYAVPLGGGEPVRLVSSETQAFYAPPGFLLFGRDNTVYAQPFDADTLEMAGEPVRVADDVMVNRGSGRAGFSVSNSGILTYRAAGGSATLADLAWYDRSGRALGTIGDRRSYYQIRLSPDGKRVAVADADRGSFSYRLSVLDLGNGVSSAMTDESLGANDPAWSPDSETIAFEAVRSGRQFFTQRVGSADATLVFESRDDPKWLDDWSADGKYLLFHLPRPSRLYVLPFDEPRTPRLLLETNETVDGAHFSPDGQWVVFQITESGQYEVWVASFPAFDRRRRVSPQGGGQAFWRGDGRELFYLTPQGKLMSVQVTPDASGTLDFATPVELFQSPLATPALTIDQYSVTKDGQRFLFIRPREETGAIPPITVVVNWAAGLSR